MLEKKYHEKFDALMDKMLPGDRHLLAPHTQSSQNTFFTNGTNSGLGPIPLHRKNYPQPPQSIGQGFIKTFNSRFTTPLQSGKTIEHNRRGK